MLQLKLTQKVQKQLGISSANLFEIEESKTILGDWFANQFHIEHRKALIFVNQKTLLSFILLGIRKDHFQRFADLFLNGLVKLLELKDFSETTINSVIDDYSEIRLTKTDSRKVLGNMNDLTDLYKHFIICNGGLKGCDLSSIIQRVNRTPQRNIDWMYSIDAARKMLGRVYLS